MTPSRREQDALYTAASAEAGPMLARLCAGYEADPAVREDLVQDVHVELWRSLALFRGECGLSTWAWRVGHAVCVRHVQKAARRNGPLVPLEALEVSDGDAGPEGRAAETLAIERLHALIHRLRPGDREVMLLYLEDRSAAEIAEITGLSPGAVATRVSRIKKLLAEQLLSGAAP